MGGDAIIGSVLKDHLTIFLKKSSMLFLKKQSIKERRQWRLATHVKKLYCVFKRSKAFGHGRRLKKCLFK